MQITENSFAALVRTFKESPKFKGYSEATQDLWGREFDFACRPKCLGAVTLDVLRPSVVQDYLDGWEDKPGKQAAALAAFRQLEKWAYRRDLISRPFTMGIETGKPQGGHTPWTEAQVLTAERHARPDIARAITLGANTGQRGSDLVRMGPAAIETYKGRQGINVTQKKTGKQVWVPITGALATAMATWERRPGPFLTRADGRPWTREALSNAWLYERDHNRELAEHKAAGLVMHGLRAHACVRLVLAGVNTRGISDMVGMSEEMVARYTRFSLQRDNATAAVIQLEGTPQEHRRNMSNKTVA